MGSNNIFHVLRFLVIRALPAKPLFVLLSLAVLATACLKPLRARAEGGEWAFLPGERTFKPLLADPREAQTGVLAYTGQSRFEGAVGAGMELLRYSPPDQTQWGLELRGAGFLLLDEDGATFPMRAADWYAGLSLCESSGFFSHRLEFLHQSAHLGDALEGVLEPTIYTGENFNFTSAFQPSENLKLYAGIGVWENRFPRDNALFVLLGAEVFSQPLDPFGTFLRGYLAFHLKWKGEAGGVWNKSAQLGIQWKFNKDESKALRVALVYFGGNAEFGQFYLEPDEHWAVGIYFDP